MNTVSILTLNSIHVSSYLTQAFVYLLGDTYNFYFNILVYHSILGVILDLFLLTDPLVLWTTIFCVFACW